jgi:acetylornithine deacetylase/succinyl-diaminopimelate desuccinylase-like protein
MRFLPALLATLLLAANGSAATDTDSPHAAKTLEIYQHIIEVDSSEGSGGAPVIAAYLAEQLLAAGFPQEDLEVIKLEDTAAFIARFRGDGSAGAAPILLLGHMDVVGAAAEDWERPPFQLTREDGRFYGRGTIDNKFGIAQLTATFIRLRNEGFVPNRDLVLVFSGDEETDQTTTRHLTSERADIADAAFALNSDAGGGILDADGRPVVYRIQTAEKTYATFEITARNPGGHSAAPSPDNAIYELAGAITRLQAHRFPVRWTKTTRSYFEETGRQTGGELGDAMLRFAADPDDQQAADRLFGEPSYVGGTRTTCVPTLLRAGQAENALPQVATVTVNCRIFPGVPVEEVRSVLHELAGPEDFEIGLVGPPVVQSPPSPLPDDVLAAVRKAVHARYPGVPLMPYMSSGVTDGMYFREAGIPTWAIRGAFAKPGESRAHGQNENVPVDSFYGALDHWSIILRELAGSE